jgi:sulfur-oxidizing protein SoxX
VADEAIPEPLTSTPGDANRGRALVLDRSNGKCVTCHQLPLPADFFCDIGPSLAELAERYTIEKLRLRIFDSKRINPESNVPSNHRVFGLTAVRRDWVGRPELTSREVADVLAYLKTLR